MEALILALAPSGAALSLDQRRRVGTFWSAQTRAPWALRLLQIQLTIVYLATFVARVGGDKWAEGTALSYALRLEDMMIVPVPQWISMNPPLVNMATWGTLIGEVMIGVLIWNLRCRRFVIVVGVLLHVAIMVTIAVGYFTPAMLVLYLAFAAPETVRRLPESVKKVVIQRLPSRDPRRAAEPPHDQQTKKVPSLPAPRVFEDDRSNADSRVLKAGLRGQANWTSTGA